MRLDSTGWIEPARRVVSPHCDARPEGSEIELVVIHGISLPPGRFGGPWIDDLFLGRLDPAADPFFAEIAGLRLSSHLLIRRDGELVQYVPLQQRAWHAGRSCWRGRERCNDFSIGIELEGTDTTPYSEPQYGVLVPLLDLLHRHCPRLAGVVGHSDIAPGRKSDPGPAFDWERLSAYTRRHE